MIRRTLCATFVLSLSLALVACGGGSGGSPGGGRTPGDGSDGGTDPGGDPDPGENPSTPLTGLYDGWGLTPANTRASVDLASPAAAAVGPGYLAVAALQALTDVRMNMQNFEWSVAELVRRAAEQHGAPLQPGEDYAVSCDLRSEPEAEGYVGTGEALVRALASYADGGLAAGEEVQFSLRACKPSGGMQAMSTIEPVRLLYSQHSYQLNGLSTEFYSNVLFGSSGWLTRTDRDDIIGCDAEPRCGQMYFENAGPDGQTSDFSIEQVGAEQPLQIRVWHDGQQARGGRIETYVEPADMAMTFIAPEIYLHFDPGAAGNAEFAGRYVLRTQEERGLVLQYDNRSLATNTFHILAGGFSVETPNGVVYHYSVASDPAYLEVSSGDGLHLDQVPQEVVTQRLRLADR